MALSGVIPMPPAIRIWVSPASLSGKLLIGSDEVSRSPWRKWSCTQTEPPRLSASRSTAIT